MLPRKVGDHIHVARTTKGVHGQNRLGSAIQTFSGVLDIEGHGAGADIHKGRHVPEHMHGCGGSPGRVGGRQDFAARREVERKKHRLQRAGAVHVRLGVRRMKVLLDLVFKRGNFIVRFVVIEQADDHALFFLTIARPLHDLLDFLARHGDGGRASRYGQRGAARGPWPGSTPGARQRKAHQCHTAGLKKTSSRRFAGSRLLLHV